MPFEMHVIGIVILLFSTTSGEDVFGPFEMRINRIENCKGPKKLDCTRITYNVVNQGQQIEVYVVFPENIKLTEFRLTVAKALTGVQPLVNIQLRNPCQQVFVGDYIKTITKDAHSCIIPKGSYNLTVDVAMLNQKFWGGKFFYGNLSNKALVLNDKCNIACNIMNVTISPKS